ncbi:U-box domain-containing protein 16 [Plakobranchus ocellatus]|uniref:U-box domain-containing protein 16 n=1 Tax=Plakobranchus ocellatus TaxID=259542 RepID=A0AAV3ZHP8_9GAST|nr:U-box domain-containing protein 16 [Plakobranchus ocellatus]
MTIIRYRHASTPHIGRVTFAKSTGVIRKTAVVLRPVTELGKNGKDIAVLRHEAISGRRDEDIASASHVYIGSLRDTEKLTMWLGNCSGQNKNWTLFTMMLFIVNCPRYEVKEIHLKYFEPGHTFMASDAALGRTEKQLRKMGKVFDFRDFVDATKQAKCEPVEMAITDFNDW